MSDNGRFPLFIDLDGRRILVIGAGMIAARRIRTLLLFTGRIEAAARELSPEVQVFVDEGKVKIVGSEFSEDLLDGVFIVLACTDDRRRNSQICRAAKKRGILSNNCSDQTECDFFFPSVVKQEELVIGINAGGTDHKKVKEVRKKIERITGNNEADYNRNQREHAGTDTK
mgnify:FL=1